MSVKVKKKFRKTDASQRLVQSWFYEKQIRDVTVIMTKNALFLNLLYGFTAAIIFRFELRLKGSPSNV